MKGAPQDVQNFASGRFSDPHEEHFLFHAPRGGGGVAVGTVGGGGTYGGTGYIGG